MSTLSQKRIVSENSHRPSAKPKLKKSRLEKLEAVMILQSTDSSDFRIKLSATEVIDTIQEPKYTKSMI